MCQLNCLFFALIPDASLISASVDDPSLSSQATSAEMSQQLSDQIQVDFSCFKNRKRVFDDESEANKQIAVLKKAMEDAEQKFSSTAAPASDMDRR